MSTRNVNIVDTIDQYELIKTRKEQELLLRSPEGANFIFNLESGEKIASILLFDEKIRSRFNVPEHPLQNKLTKFNGDYSVDEKELRQDRSLLAEVDGYTLLPTSLHGKDFIHLRKDGINFILSIKVLFEIISRYNDRSLY